MSKNQILRLRASTKKRTHAHAPRGPHAGIPNFENGILVYMLVLPGKFSTTALYSCSTKAVQAT